MRRVLPVLLVVVVGVVGASEEVGLGLSIDALPKRYRLDVRNEDGDQRRSRGWADGVDLRLRWTLQEEGDWIIAIDGGASARRDGDLGLRALDLGLVVARAIAAGGRGRLLAIGRYGVGGILVDDGGDRADGRAWGAITRLTLGGEGWLALGGGGEAGLLVGYEAGWVRDAWGAGDVSGFLAGPVAALEVGWRW